MRKKMYSKTGNGIYTIDTEKGIVKFTMKAYNTYFTGKAECFEHDVFNIDTGMEIAYLRAVKNMKKFYLKNLKLDRRIADIYMSEKVGSRMVNMLKEEENIVLNKIHSLDKRINELCK